MAHNDGLVGVTFIWAIENFDLILEWTSQSILSPVFLSEALDYTKWFLSLKSRVCRYQYNALDFIELDLVRDAGDEGAENVIVDCELSLLAYNGLPLERFEVKNYEFTRGRALFWPKSAPRGDVLNSRKSQFLSQGTLTVRCRMWRRIFNELPKAESRFACTRMSSERLCFTWNINDFSCLQPLQRKTISIVKTSSEIPPLLTFEFFLEGNDQAEIEVTRTDCQRGLIAHCKIEVLDGAGNLVGFREGSHSFPFQLNALNPSKQVWRFPSFISKRKLVENSTCYLPMDTLSLRCECFVWEDLIGQIKKSQPFQNFQVIMDQSALR